MKIPIPALLCPVPLLLFVVLWFFVWRSKRGAGSFFFDAQDFFAMHNRPVGRELPRSAESGTFEAILKHYIGVTQLIITVAAASIAFGGSSQSGALIAGAKLSLAYSILFGVLFCAFLLFRYDEYGQDVNSYTARWYSLVIALGVCCLLWFIFGYLVWALGAVYFNPSMPRR